MGTGGAVRPGLHPWLPLHRRRPQDGGGGLAIIPALVFGVPIFDAFFVISRRLLSGQPITQADKRHLHHTLLGRGLSQKQTVWVLYAATGLLCLAALLVIQKYAQ